MKKQKKHSTQYRQLRYGLDDEFGLVTANMTEQAFAQAAAQFDVAGRIRFDKTTI